MPRLRDGNCELRMVVGMDASHDGYRAIPQMETSSMDLLTVHRHLVCALILEIVDRWMTSATLQP
jgi:hypothetical protein